MLFLLNDGGDVRSRSRHRDDDVRNRIHRHGVDAHNRIHRRDDARSRSRRPQYRHK